MEKNALKARLLWSSIVILIAVLGIAAFPCLAEEPINLQQLFAGQTIKIDNVVFENFSKEMSFPEFDFTQITVEKVGVGTLNPGLRFIPNPQLNSPPWSTEGDQTQFTILTYQARILNDLPLIKGTTLILEPGSVEPAGDYYSGPMDPDFAAVTVKDEEGLREKLVYEQNALAPSSDVYLHEKRVSVETNLAPVIAVSPYLFVTASSTRPGGKASLAAFEQRFLLLPAPGGPIAEAGPDQVVTDDKVALDGSKSTGVGLSFVWILENTETKETEQETVEKPVFKDLNPGIYIATLTVKDENGFTDTDSAFVAVGEPCEDQGGSLPAALHLWRFKITKYKYCNWAFARVYGTVDASDFPLDSSIDEDGLEARVILQVMDNDKNILGEWSAETPAEIKDRNYKHVIQNKW